MAIHKEVLFNNGEGLVHTDLNNLQGYIRSQIFDTLGQVARLGLGGIEDQYRLPSASYCYAIGAGGAPTAIGGSFYGGSGRTMKNRAGVIFQMIGDATDQDPGTPSGDSPEFLAYHVEEDELETTFAANASGSDRIDLVCIKLDVVTGDPQTRDIEDATTRVVTTESLYKQSQVRLVKTVVQGTPAGSPVEPAVPSGFVRLAAAYITNGLTDLVANLLRDHRIPIGIKFIDVSCDDVTGSSIPNPSTFKGTWSNANSVLGGRNVTALSGGEAYMIAAAKGIGGNQRILGVMLHENSNTAADWTATLQELSYGGASQMENISSDLFLAPAQLRFSQSSLLDIPIWGNAGRAGHAMDIDAGFDSMTLPFQVGLKLRTTVAPSTSIEFVRFIIAGVL